MRGLKDKVVVVTGGGGGIGGATCSRFAAEGAKVAVFDMNLESAQKVADNITAAGGSAAAFKCDITDRAQVDAAVAAAEAQLGPIAVLVNNAGWDVFKPFVKTVPAEWERLIAINLTGALHMLHAAARRAKPSTLPARGAWWHSAKPWRVNMPARASRSTWCAQDPPTPPCLPVWPKVRATRPN